MQAPPHTGGLPVAQPAPAAHPAAAVHLGRQHLPGEARAEHEQDTGQGGAVVQPRTPTLGARRVRRQKRGDRSPEIVGKKRASHTSPTRNRHDRAVLLGALNLLRAMLARPPEARRAAAALARWARRRRSHRYRGRHKASKFRPITAPPPMRSAQWRGPRGLPHDLSPRALACARASRVRGSASEVVSRRSASLDRSAAPTVAEWAAARRLNFLRRVRPMAWGTRPPVTGS